LQSSGELCCELQGDRAILGDLAPRADHLWSAACHSQRLLLARSNLAVGVLNSRTGKRGSLARSFVCLVLCLLDRQGDALPQAKASSGPFFCCKLAVISVRIPWDSLTFTDSGKKENGDKMVQGGTGRGWEDPTLHTIWRVLPSSSHSVL